MPPERRPAVRGRGGMEAELRGFALNALSAHISLPLKGLRTRGEVPFFFVIVPRRDPRTGSDPSSTLFCRIFPMQCRSQERAPCVWLLPIRPQWAGSSHGTVCS
jgi:hypothetical protein